MNGMDFSKFDQSALKGMGGAGAGGDSDDDDEEAGEEIEPEATTI